jgi:antibiotic biosynthesis monooxygenase (ABM) superfamily enzyme
MNEPSNMVAMPTAVLIKMRLRPGVEQGFSSWHAKMCTIAAELPGFISAEVIAPSPSGPPEWRIIQHFRSDDQLRAWRQSDQHRRLLLEAESLVEKNGTAGLFEEEAPEAHEDGTVTEVVTTYVRPDKADEYREWAAKIHKVEAQFPGYRGGFLQPPTSASQSYWTTLVRFATPEQLEAWLNSSEREKLLREHEALVSSWSHHRLPTSFAGWFPTDQTAGASPPAWKQSMLVMLMLFPVVMAEMRFLSPLTSGLNPALGMFIGNVISILLLGWPLMPLIIRALKWWLLPAPDGAWWINPAGLVLVVALYAVEIAALWNLVS